MPQNPDRGVPQFTFKTVGVESEELYDFQVPVFVNSTNVWHYGQDVYLDMALLTVEQMNAIPTLNPGDEVTVAVYDRFVMSPSVFDHLAKNIIRVREQLKQEGLVRDEQTET